MKNKILPIKMEQIFSSYFASLITEEDKVELSSAVNKCPHVLGKELAVAPRLCKGF